jgi:hypothetical protein
MRLLHLLLHLSRLAVHIGDHGTVNEGLPAGWTIERVRQASGDSEAAVVSPGRRVRVLEVGSNGSFVPLEAEVIISFHGLCLVLADDDWYMGHFNDDGSADCWASYGSNFEEALRGL